jgi:chitin synthase
MKNLLHLGEDRYLTTLLMKHFPNLKLSYTQDAKCRTNAPDRWSILVSQRRRWINSTVHNLFELVFLPQLCGFCCFSMRFIVFIDLFSTMVQPVGIIYLGYLFYTIATTDQSFPVISVILLASIYGFQIIIFILKRQWAQIGWMFIYLLAVSCYVFDFIMVFVKLNMCTDAGFFVLLAHLLILAL